MSSHSVADVQRLRSAVASRAVAAHARLGMSGGTGAAPAEAPPPSLPPGVRPHPAQVAGHRAEEGRAPALATEDGCFLKPLPSDARGACELAFYPARAPPRLPPRFAASALR